MFGLGSSTGARCADLDRLEEKSGFAEVGIGGFPVESGARRGFVEAYGWEENSSGKSESRCCGGRCSSRKEAKVALASVGEKVGDASSMKDSRWSFMAGLLAGDREGGVKERVLEGYMVEEMLMGRGDGSLSVMGVQLPAPSAVPPTPWESPPLPPVATAAGFTSPVLVVALCPLSTLRIPPSDTDTALIGELGALDAYSTLAAFVRRPSSPLPTRDASTARRPPGNFRLPSTSIFLLLPIIFSIFCSDDRPRMCLGDSGLPPVDGDGDADETVGDAREEPVPCESFEPCPMLCVSACCWSPMTSGGSSRMRCDSCGTGLIYGLAPALLPSVACGADTGEAGLETGPAG